jgi:hypothetical protein
MNGKRENSHSHRNHKMLGEKEEEEGKYVNLMLKI